MGIRSAKESAVSFFFSKIHFLYNKFTIVCQQNEINIFLKNKEKIPFSVDNWLINGEISWKPDPGEEWKNSVHLSESMNFLETLKLDIDSEAGKSYTSPPIEETSYDWMVYIDKNFPL